MDASSPIAMVPLGAAAAIPTPDVPFTPTKDDKRARHINALEVLSVDFFHLGKLYRRHGE